MEALINWEQDPIPDGTYELIGPKVNGNRENSPSHRFVRHGSVVLEDARNARDFNSIKRYLEDHRMEGIVWHHPDGRMIKIKSKDFGIPW